MEWFVPVMATTGLLAAVVFPFALVRAIRRRDNYRAYGVLVCAAGLAVLVADAVAPGWIATHLGVGRVTRIVIFTLLMVNLFGADKWVWGYHARSNRENEGLSA